MRARRVLVSVPVLFALVVGGAPAVAADDDRPDLRLGVTGERAATGTPVRKAATAAEGVIRRTARLDDVEHAAAATPSQRLSTVDVTVDVVAQTMTASVALGGAPDPAAPVVVVIGTWSGSTCTPAFGVQAQGGAAGAQFVGGGTVAASQTTAGNIVTIASAAHPQLGAGAYDCAYAHVVDPANPGYAISVAYAESLEETFRPVLEVEADEKVVGAKKGRWARLGVEVRNTSRGSASAVRLAVSGKGIEVQPKVVDIGAVEDRSTEYLDLKVRLTPPKGKKKSKKLKPRTLTLTVTDPGAATATAQAQVVLTPKPTRLKKLTGTYWWGWESTDLQSSAGWINHSVWFVDKKWAYTGWAEGRKPRCSAKVKECLRYSYNARTGTVKIGKQKARVTSEGFSFRHPAYKAEKLDLEPLTLPKKGTRLGVDLYHQNWSGYCAISCTSYTDYLTMDTDGKFVEGGFSVGSWPGLGQSWSSAPADQRGTYKVVATGIVEMAYADGTRKREVIGIQHDPSGKPNAAFEGVLIGDTNYYE